MIRKTIKIIYFILEKYINCLENCHVYCQHLTGKKLLATLVNRARGRERHYDSEQGW